MSSLSTELSTSREKLFAVLGEHRAEYLEHLNSWFSSKSTKEQFDAEAIKLLTVGHIRLHNEFLLAILNKCQTQEDFGPKLSPERGKAERCQGN